MSSPERTARERHTEAMRGIIRHYPDEADNVRQAVEAFANASQSFLCCEPGHEPISRSRCDGCRAALLKEVFGE